MKVLVGITQNLDETRQYIDKEFTLEGIRTEVGPFTSAEAAGRWMHYIMGRADQCHEVMVPQTSAAGLWYGFTLESKDN